MLLVNPIIDMTGFIIAIASLLYAIYTRHKQKRTEEQAEKRRDELINKQENLEKQLERKDSLREMANDMRSVIEWMNTFSEGMSRRSDPDETPYDTRYTVWPCLRHFCKDLLAYKHQYNSTPDIRVSVYTRAEGGEQVPIKSPDEAINSYENHDIPAISISIDDKQGYADQVIFCHLNKAFEGAETLKCRMSPFKKEHGDMLDQFSPGLMMRLEEQVDTILSNSIENALQSTPQISYDPDHYENLHEMEIDIFEEVLIYNDIGDDLSDLYDIINELEETRKSIVQTSYS